MTERDRPTYSTDIPQPDHYYSPPIQTLRPSSEWFKRADEMDQAQAADVAGAIKEAADLQADVLLHRKRGSMFLGIELRPGDGPMVKILEYPGQE